MTTHPDFEELLRFLGANEVDYMVVGGYAVAFHGHPRFTKDIDIFFDDSHANIERLRRALVDFGFEPEDLPSDAFAERNNVLTFGVAPTRVDLLNEIAGVTFDEAQPNIVEGHYGSARVPFIGLEDLLQNKRSTKRSRDMADVEELMRVHQDG